jgi:maleylacetoacetate isomerase
VRIGFDEPQRAVTPGQAAVLYDGELVVAGGWIGQNWLTIVSTVNNARRWGVDLAPYPRLAAIADRAEALPAFAAAHPDRVKPQA